MLLYYVGNTSWLYLYLLIRGLARMKVDLRKRRRIVMKRLSAYDPDDIQEDDEANVIAEDLA